MSARDILIEALRRDGFWTESYVACTADAILADKRIAVVELPESNARDIFGPQWDAPDLPLVSVIENFDDDRDPSLPLTWIEMTPPDWDGDYEQPQPEKVRRLAVNMLAAANTAEATK
jgi:hypothetical protein